jgi:thymidylate kinase
LVFVVIEGFSGTGKTTLARRLEKEGWMRMAESAHVVPREVPVADRADTFADYSLLGATMVYSSLISSFRPTRNLVSEGYLLSDLAYARIRFDLKKSDAYPSMLDVCGKIMSHPQMKPDLYLLLKATADNIAERQARKNERERNLDDFFRERYYSALQEIHDKLGEKNVETVFSDSHADETFAAVKSVLERKNIA